MKNKEIEELLNELKEYASGGMSGLYPSEDTVKNFVSYIEQLETKVKNLQNQVNTINNNNEELKRRLKIVQQKRDTHKAMRYKLENNRDKAIEILDVYGTYRSETADLLYEALKGDSDEFRNN